MAKDGTSLGLLAALMALPTFIGFAFYALLTLVFEMPSRRAESCVGGPIAVAFLILVVFNILGLLCPKRQ